MTLKDDSNFVGFARDSSSGISVVLQRNGLHLEILVDPTRADRGHKAGIVDVRVESAMSVRHAPRVTYPSGVMRASPHAAL